MQSGGQAAGIQLQVGLDLAFFRNQLPKLGAAAAGYPLTFKVEFDRRSIQNQLNALGTNIKKRTYFLEVKTNLAAEIELAKQLATALDKLGRSQQTAKTGVGQRLGVGAIGRAPSQGGLGSKDVEKLYRASARAGLLVFDKEIARTKVSMVAAMDAIGVDAIAGLLNGLSSQDARLRAAAESIGENLIKTTKTSLGIASPSKKFEEIGRNVGKGFEKGALSSMDNAFDAMENKMRQRGKILDTIARGIFGMLGMDPAAMMQQARQQRLPAAINWQATTPPRQPFTGPSSGGRALPPGPSQMMLPGTSFGRQKYLPTALGEELKKVLRDAANAFVDTLKTQIRTAKVLDLGRTMQPTLPGSTRIAGLLSPEPPGRYRAGRTEETQAELFARREREARMRSALRGVDVMGETPTRAPARYSYANRPAMPRRPTSAIIPYEGGGSLVPTGGGAGGGGGRRFPSDGPLGGRQGPATFIGAGSQMEKFKTGLDIAAASTRNFTASQIPLVGGIKNLAGEFGQAAKQVLLYGTAYKGLAFLISLPGQVLNAAKSQQQFNNGLKVATQETGTFAKELLYVDNVQRAFGLNLETTRTGFTRLYASMAPTGFDSGSIEKLFTGISAATAALQLTPDKAERVIYAFGQMASKGQIMAEELKGQLGDVLPGALAIFSKAAGMSVKEFSKAMEDGEFTGNRFREVFAKVSDELMNRFGTGAQVAGRSLQGLINTVGGDFQRTLESFAPLANAAAQATLGPLTGMLREVSMAAQIAMGEQDRVRKQLEAAQADVSTLKLGGADAKEIKAAEQNVAALAAKYEVLNEAAKDPAISQQVKNIEVFVVEIQKAATFTMNLAGIIGSALNPLFTALGGNLTSVISNLALLALGFNAAKLAALLMMGVVNTMNAIQGITATGAAGTTALAGAFRLLGIQATGAQVATIGFGVAIKGLLISTGIGAVVVLLGSLAAAFLSVGNKAKEAADRAKRSIDSMADAARTGNVSLIEMELSVNKADRQDVENLIKSVEQLKGRTGGKGVQLITLTPELKREAKRLGVEVAGEVSRGSVLGSLKILRKPLQEAAAEGVQDLAAARKRAEALGMNKPDPSAAAAGEEASGAGKPPKEKSLESYYSLQDQLAKAQTQADIDRLEAAFEHARAMVNAEYDLKEAKANSFQKKAIAFQKEIFAITSEQDAALFKNRNKVLAAAGSVAGGAGPAIGGVVATTGGAVNQDPLTRGRSTGAHLHAQAAGVTEKTLRYLVDKYLEIGGKTASAFGQSRGSAGHGYNAIDFLTPQNTPIKLKPGASMSQYGPAGGRGGLMSQVTTPEGSFQLGHLSSLTPGGRGTAPGKVTGDVKRDKLAEQQVALTAREVNAANIEKEAEATAKLEIATANYVQSLVPTTEQALQNQLLQQRITLTRNSFSPEILEAQLAFAEQELQVTQNIKNNTEEINRLTAAGSSNTKQINALTDANNQLKASLPVSAIQLLTEAVDKERLAIVGRARAATQDAENREKVNDLIIGGMTRQAAEAKVTADMLRNNYKKALEEATRQVDIAAAAEEAFAIAKRMGKVLTAEQTAEYNALAEALKKAREEKERLEGKAPEVEGDAKNAEGAVTPKTTKGYLADGLSDAQERLTELTNTGYQVVQAANAIGDAFGTAFKGLVSGSMTAQEALAGMFQSIADHFADMVAQMIAEWLKAQLIKGFMSILGMLIPGGGGGIGAGLSSGFDAGPSSAIDTSAAGWGTAFNTPLKFANGGIAAGGFQAFANGGMVTGPTMGLVGEGRYNEAIVPLPDGKSIPVELAGGGSSSPTVIVNVDAKGSQVEGNEQNANQLGRVISAAVQTELIKQQRPGGLLAR
jgi:tape measure domain-containing protein